MALAGLIAAHVLQQFLIYEDLKAQEKAQNSHIEESKYLASRVLAKLRRCVRMASGSIAGTERGQLIEH